MKALIGFSLILMLENVPSQAQQGFPLLDSVVTYSYLKSSDSILSAKTAYSYNLWGVRTSTEQYHRNQSGTGWYLFFYDRDSFDILGNRIARVQYSLIERGLRYPYVMHAWEYTSDQYPVTERILHKQNVGDDWQCDSLGEFKRNINGKVLEITLYTRMNNAESLILKKWSSYSYNEAGFVIEELNQYWNVAQKTWELGYRWETNYWPNGMRRSKYLYFWNAYNQVWRKEEMKWAEYDSLGRIIKKRDYNIGAQFQWEYDYCPSGDYSILLSSSAVGQTFIPNYIFNFFANESGQITCEDKYFFSRGNSTWIPQTRTERTYHMDGSPDQVHIRFWNSDINDWVLDRKSYYYYSASSGVFDRTINDEIFLFPNPTSGIINITGLSVPANIKIYDLQGQLLKSFLQVQNTIDISNLHPGIYIMNIISGDKRLVKKVIRE